VLARSDVHMQEQVRAVVAIQSHVLLIGEVTGGQEALAAVAACAPDVLVLDMQISGVHACNVTRTTLTHQPQLGIVVWIELDDGELPDSQAWMMQGAGVCGVDSAADHAEIEQAIYCSCCYRQGIPESSPHAAEEPDAARAPTARAACHRLDQSPDCPDAQDRASDCL
jgi:DNA-binding NarL/FixJ family response regulator